MPEVTATGSTSQSLPTSCAPGSLELARALDVSEDHRLRPAAADKPVEDDRLEKREAQRIRS